MFKTKKYLQQQNIKTISFPTDIVSIESRVREIDPEKYASTRNHKNGAVTHLSPYISRGVISTKQVYQHIKTLDLPWYKIEKLIQELAWRDYWQQVWRAKRDEIRQDLKNIQTPVSNHQVPRAIINAETGIEAVDDAIKKLYETGYMHNHMRMYVAAICCNMAHSHWRQPTDWMYSNLLDGDIASNYLSWQWVAGAFANKKYVANQENINNFFESEQRGTFLDVPYEAFENFTIPAELEETIPFQLETKLPKLEIPTFEKEKTTLIYNYYNLDPYWHSSENVQRVLLMEPSFFKLYPVSQNCIDFVLALTENIPGIKVFVGEFDELSKLLQTVDFVYKEHPTNAHYRGKEESRDWLSAVEGYYPSFFSFWKKCKKTL
jgi:deoxyribodipyrimidine photo-lyase